MAASLQASSHSLGDGEGGETPRKRQKQKASIPTASMVGDEWLAVEARRREEIAEKRGKHVVNAGSKEEAAAWDEDDTPLLRYSDEGCRGTLTNSESVTPEQHHPIVRRTFPPISHGTVGEDFSSFSSPRSIAENNSSSAGKGSSAEAPQEYANPFNAHNNGHWEKDENGKRKWVATTPMKFPITFPIGSRVTTGTCFSGLRHVFKVGPGGSVAGAEREDKWWARISWRGKKISCGVYKCRSAAARAADLKAISLGVPSEKLNYPQYHSLLKKHLKMEQAEPYVNSPEGGAGGAGGEGGDGGNCYLFQPCTCTYCITVAKAEGSRGGECGSGGGSQASGQGGRRGGMSRSGGGGAESGGRSEVGQGQGVLGDGMSECKEGTEVGAGQGDGILEVGAGQGDGMSECTEGIMLQGHEIIHLFSNNPNTGVCPQGGMNSVFATTARPVKSATGYRGVSIRRAGQHHMAPLESACAASSSSAAAATSAPAYQHNTCVYDVEVYYKGKQYQVGTFSTAEEGARAYDKKCRALGKPLSFLNFPYENDSE